MGFLELREIGIPSVPWKEYEPNKTVLDNNCLWTIRTAVLRGDDFNLPRLVGANAEEATRFANNLCNNYKGNAMIIYYPYFKALKSGVLEVKQFGYIIESVKEDLWNLVTDGKRNQTLIYENEVMKVDGEQDFLTDNELCQLKNSITIVRFKFAKALRSGDNVLLEWSFAQNVDVNNEPNGSKYLVFYECRTI